MVLGRARAADCPPRTSIRYDIVTEVCLPMDTAWAAFVQHVPHEIGGVWAEREVHARMANAPEGPVTPPHKPN
jgi:hypothetical protein